jgi:hypothetical protein
MGLAREAFHHCVAAASVYPSFSYQLSVVGGQLLVVISDCRGGKIRKR